MMNTLRVAVDVGSRFHQVAIGDGSGRLLDEFQIDHGREGFEQFFARIGRHPATDVRVAMEGYNGWARPLDQQVLARGWRGFHHHASLCIAAYGFLTLEQLAGRKKTPARFKTSALPEGFQPRGAGADAAP